MSIDTTIAYIRREQDRFRSELFDFLRIPSVSTAREHDGDVRRAAGWLADRVRRAGLAATVEETVRSPAVRSGGGGGDGGGNDVAGHPVVVGRHHAGDDAPTLLVYGHYDVQPPDPLAAWTSAPFEPEVRGGRIWARGAADDKSQVLLQVIAAEAALATGELPVNLVLLFEGEEEIGSPGLVRFVLERAAELSTDHVVIADSMMFAPGWPSLIFGTRGIAYFEVEATIGSTDLHSGQYGGAVPNPANALAAVIASMHSNGRIAIEGFYDDVAEAPADLREGWARLRFDEEAFRAGAGSAALAGEPGYTTIERLWIRPTLDVNGLVSGYTGPGKKTVLPSRALAKLSARLVPDQDPNRVGELLRAHVRREAPRGVRFEVRAVQGSPPWRDDPEAPLYRSAARALEGAFGTPPVLVNHGGTLPIAPVLRTALDAPVCIMGFALPGANMHAPNEWFPEAHLALGAETVVRLYRELADDAFQQGSTPSGPTRAPGRSG